jgi:hypothetical protein
MHCGDSCDAVCIGSERHSVVFYLLLLLLRQLLLLLLLVLFLLLLPLLTCVYLQWQTGPGC